jgi:hypothetical protein
MISLATADQVHPVYARNDYFHIREDSRGFQCFDVLQNDVGPFNPNSTEIVFGPRNGDAFVKKHNYEICYKPNLNFDEIDRLRYKVRISINFFYNTRSDLY